MADEEVTVVVDERGITALREPGGPVYAALERAGEHVVERSQERAPVSPYGNHGNPPGYLRDHIRAEIDVTPDETFLDLISDARSPKGYPYARRRETADPYMERDLS
jgi:hypothetical protein